jgi:hypothetical protein
MLYGVLVIKPFKVLNSSQRLLNLKPRLPRRWKITTNNPSSCLLMNFNVARQIRDGAITVEPGSQGNIGLSLTMKVRHHCEAIEWRVEGMQQVISPPALKREEMLFDALLHIPNSWKGMSELTSTYRQGDHPHVDRPAGVTPSSVRFSMAACPERP